MQAWSVQHKDRAAAMDVKEVQTEGERELEGEE